MMTEQWAGKDSEGNEMCIMFQAWPGAPEGKGMFYAAVALTPEAKARFDADDEYRCAVRRQMETSITEAIWDELGIGCYSADCNQPALQYFLDGHGERVPVCGGHLPMFWSREPSA